MVKIEYSGMSSVRSAGEVSADFEIAALHRLDFGALCEQCSVVVNLDVEDARHRLFERFLEGDQRLGLPFGIGARRGNADNLNIGLGSSGQDAH